MRWVFVAATLATGALAGCLGDDLGDVIEDGMAPSVAFTALCPGATEAWPDPCTMLASPNDSPSKAEIELRINPTDPDNVVIASKDLDLRASNCVWSVVYVTKDAGATWTSVYVGGESGAGREPTLQPFACVTDPIMTFDADGRLYYALQAYRAAIGPRDNPTVGVPPYLGSTFQLATSDDGGLTWACCVLMHVGDGQVQFHDYPRMITNPATGSVHTIWNGVGSCDPTSYAASKANARPPVPVNRCAVGEAQVGTVTPWVVTTRDRGATMERPVTFWVPGDELDTAFASGFVAAADGTLYVTANADGNVHLMRSDDDGRTFHHVGPMPDVNWPPRQRPQNEFRTPGFVELAVDGTEGPLGGRLYALWTDHPREGPRANQSDVLVAHSDDGGASWSDPVLANDDDTAHDQFFPRGVVDGDGVLHVLWDDRRWDPDNRLLDMVHAYSTDGGLTFVNVRLTNSSFDGDLGLHQNGPPFIGDYNGIDWSAGHLWLAWGDTRTGRAEVAAAHVVRDA